MLQKPYRQLSYGRNGGTQSENRCQMSDHCYVRTLYVWKAIPAEASKRGTPNMKLELQRVCSIDRSNAPPTSGNLRAQLAESASVFDYVIIHYLL